jgi:hypothetical protein
VTAITCAAAGAPAAGILVALGGSSILCLAGAALWTLVVLAGAGTSGTVGRPCQ